MYSMTCSIDGPSSSRASPCTARIEQKSSQRKAEAGVFVSISTTRGVMKGTYTLLNPSAVLIWNFTCFCVDIEAYSDTVTCFIRKCIEDVVPTKSSVSTPTKNHGLTAMFDQPCQRGHLPLNPETLTIGNKPVTISGDQSKQPNDNIKTKLKNISTTTTQEACDRTSTTSQGLKGINQLL